MLLLNIRLQLHLELQMASLLLFFGVLFFLCLDCGFIRSRCYVVALVSRFQRYKHGLFVV